MTRLLVTRLAAGVRVASVQRSAAGVRVTDESGHSAQVSAAGCQLRLQSMLRLWGSSCWRWCRGCCLSQDHHAHAAV